MVVPHREVVDGVPVADAVGGVGGECGLETCGVGREVVEENADVFEASVHALAVEWDHSVGGIAKDDAAVEVVVWSAL